MNINSLLFNIILYDINLKKMSKKYNIRFFKDILYEGFDFVLPQETVKLIHNLSSQVGSPNYIKTPIFKKREISVKNDNNSIHNHNHNNNNTKFIKTTPLKKGVEGKIDMIRLNLNKMTDKNYEDMKIKIMELLENDSKGEILLLNKAIFDIASNNRFYSKIYAEFYKDFYQEYEEIVRNAFETQFHLFIKTFEQIESVDPDKDYELFCVNNKKNECRKALSTFYMNLMNKGLIQKEQIIEIVVCLMTQIIENINLPNKISNVDEMTENILILLQPLNFHSNNTMIQGKTLIEWIQILSKSKSKDYLSLSTKSIFKFMDFI